MSSKKARRRERLAKQQDESRRRGLSPVAMFIIGIGAALLLTVAATMLFVDRAEAPWPGAVWSEAHGHWH